LLLVVCCRPSWIPPHEEDKMSGKKRKEKEGGGEGGKEGGKSKGGGEDGTEGGKSKKVAKEKVSKRTPQNIFDKSKGPYFVETVKAKRKSKANGTEYSIGWRGFSECKHDTWEPLKNLAGSENMVAEFKKNYEAEYRKKTDETLADLARKKKASNEKTAADSGPSDSEIVSCGHWYLLNNNWVSQCARYCACSAVDGTARVIVTQW
jgi:hypothetical protein